MKRIFSFVLVFILIFSIACLCVSAEDAAQTNINVSKGDKITYTLKLSDVPEPVVGCDFSIYYDSTVFSCDSATDEPDSAIVNSDLDGEVRGNWSNLSGEDFGSTRGIVTVNLTANDDASAHISYYIRYLYDYDLEEFSQYSFTCDVLKNGEKIIEDAAPELNTSKPQTSGEFLNSVSGKSGDAAVNTYKDGTSKGGEAVEGTEGSNTDSSKKTSDSTSASKAKQFTTDEQGNTVEVKDASANNANSGKGPSPYLFIVLGVIVLGIAALIIYFIVKSKKVEEIK